MCWAKIIRSLVSFVFFANVFLWPHWTFTAIACVGWVSGLKTYGEVCSPCKNADERTEGTTACLAGGACPSPGQKAPLCRPTATWVSLPLARALSFTMARTWKQPTCPLTNEWTNNVYIHLQICTMEYHSIIKKRQNIAACNKRVLMLSEISRTEKDKNKHNFTQQIHRYRLHIGDCQRARWELGGWNGQRRSIRWWRMVTRHTPGTYKCYYPMLPQ